jgi:hypothetical protein
LAAGFEGDLRAVVLDVGQQPVAKREEQRRDCEKRDPAEHLGRTQQTAHRLAGRVPR